ncbi:MAG: TetR/AcrR family transcriptional regulator [Bacillota bacterium]
MEQKKSDRRVRKTKEVLRKALTQLLGKMELKDITVSMLTEMADINRSTFYLHYKDAYDLFEHVENEALNDFREIITKHTQQKSLVWRSIMLDMFRYLSTNAQTVTALLGAKESSLLTKIVDMNRPASNAEWQRLFGTEKTELYEYYYAFITSGCIALARAWFNKGMPESAEEMAALAEKLMSNSILHLM